MKTIEVITHKTILPEAPIEVFDLMTEDFSFFVEGDNGPMCVHNCTFTPNPVIPTKIHSSIHDLMKRIPTKISKELVLCKDVASHKILHGKIDKEKMKNKIAAILIGKTIYLSEWAKDSKRAVLSVLGESLWKRRYASKMQIRQSLQFPVLSDEIMEVLADSQVFEEDEYGYRFSSKFLRDPQRRSGRDILDNFLVARQYGVRWDINGKPLYDARDRYASLDPKGKFTLSFQDYFLCPGILKSAQPKLFYFIHKLVSA